MDASQKGGGSSAAHMDANRHGDEKQWHWEKYRQSCSPAVRGDVSHSSCASGWEDGRPAAKTSRKELIGRRGGKVSRGRDCPPHLVGDEHEFQGDRGV